MSCCNRYINRTGQVMGEYGIPRIALRGTGCINGTGRCNVAGAAGRCTNVFGTGDDLCDDVAGSGGRRRRYCNCDYYDDIAGSGGNDCNRCDLYDSLANIINRRRRCEDVAGSRGRRRDFDCCLSCLETPTTVPR